MKSDEKFSISVRPAQRHRIPNSWLENWMGEPHLGQKELTSCMPKNRITVVLLVKKLLFSFFFQYLHQSKKQVDI